MEREANGPKVVETEDHLAALRSKTYHASVQGVMDLNYETLKRLNTEYPSVVNPVLKHHSDLYQLMVKFGLIECHYQELMEAQ